MGKIGKFLIGLMFFIFVCAKVGNLFLLADAKSDFAEDFALSPEGASFAVECLLSDDDFGYEPGTGKRKFCGCVSQDLARSLSTDDLQVAAFAFEQNREKGIAIPTGDTARTPAAARVATAVEDGMARCRYNFG